MESSYGRARPRPTAVAIVFFSLLITFVAWSGWHYATTPIRTQVVSFTATDNSLTIRYQVTRRDAARAVVCRVAAENYQRRVVGEIADEIPAGLATLTRTVQVPTLSRASVGFVGPCRHQ